METPSVHSLQPTSPLASRAAAPAALEDGQQLSARVLGTLEGGLVLLEVAGQRLAARAELALVPGQLYDFRVEASEQGWVLHLIEPASNASNPLLRALRGWVGYDRPLSEILEELRAALAPAAGGGDARARIAQRLLAQLDGLGYTPDGGDAGLHTWLARSGLAHEALLLALGGRAADSAALAHGLRSGFKSALLEALAQLPPGREREAVEHALKALEAEQLVQLARRDGGDDLHLDLPVPDAGRWAQVHLRVERRGESRREARPGARGGDTRASLSLELSQLGGLRIDIALHGEQLQLRLRAAEAGTVELLEQRLPELVAALEARGKRTQAVVQHAPLHAELHEGGLAGASMLGAGHLMDVRG